jgi:hypothetical protein
MQNVDGELDFRHPEVEAITSDIQAFMPFVKRFREAKLAARFVKPANLLLRIWIILFYVQGACNRTVQR